jgi:hypothetical protein
MTLQESFDELIVEVVPEKYRDVRLSLLQPSPKSRLSLAEQATLYDELRANPNSGWAFFAPAGYSKTTCSYALYKYALADNMKRCHQTGKSEFVLHTNGRPAPQCYVWRKSVPDLLQQHFTHMDDRNAPKPGITVEKIERAKRDGITPRVFLEEIDKIKPSEFATNQLFRIFDAIDRHRGQIVLDTNFSRQQFLDTFGEPIYRRVKENCIVKEFGF